MYTYQMMNNQPSEAIEKLLSNKDTTIEDLLREEELIQQLKNKNEKLIEYFDKEKIKKLLDYIIKEPEIKEENLDIQENKDKGLKFPFICSQIFDLRIDELFQYFFMTNEEIEKKENEKNNKKKEQNIEPKDKEKGPEDNIKKEKEIKIPEDNIKKGVDDKIPENNIKIEDKIPEDNKVKDIIDTKINENKNEKNQKSNEVNEESSKNKADQKKNEVDNKGNDNKEENEQQKNKSNDYKLELLDYLFSFLPNEINENNKLNYVLCGYFNSLIINLLNVNPTVFLNYVYNIRKDVFDLLIKNSYRKSISETLSKILDFENYSPNNPNEKNMSEIRLQILEKIFKLIDIKKDNEEINSIYFFITGLFDSTSISELKKCFENMIDNETIINCLFKPFDGLDLNNNSANIEKKRQNFMVIIDIIIFLLTNIKTLKCEIPTYNEESKKIKHTKLSKKILDILLKLININFKNKNKCNNKILQSFDDIKIIPFGEYKIKIVELIWHLIPYFNKSSKDFDEILIKSGFFKVAFEYIEKFEWNNIYQESFLSLLKTLFDQSAHHDLLADHLFKKIKIINIIKSLTDTGNKVKFKKNYNPISHGYISFFANLCYKINTVIGGTPLKVNKNPSTEGSFEFIYNPEERDIWNEEAGAYKNKEEEEEKGIPIKSMEKYMTTEWKDLFDKNIKEIIIQYCDREWPKVEKTTDAFDFLFQDGDDSKQNETENKNTNEENEKNKEDGLNSINNNGQEINNANINSDEKKEINEEIKGDIKEENKEEVKRENKEEIKEGNKMEVKEEIKEEVKGENKNELKEENKNEIKEGNKVEVKEEIKKEEKGEIENKIKEENKEEEKGVNKEGAIEKNKQEVKEKNKNEEKEENKKDVTKKESKKEVKGENKIELKGDNKKEVKKDNKNEVKGEVKKDLKKEDNKKEVKGENKKQLKKDNNKKEMKVEVKKEVKKDLKKEDNKKEMKGVNKKDNKNGVKKK